VGDTGCGIPSENLSRIFEAFFTTKVDGTGTGLGLWVAHNILNKHHATLRMRSSVAPGRCGTVVSVFLPLGFEAGDVKAHKEALATA
jgi:signal transduction histidine kinase